MTITQNQIIIAGLLFLSIFLLGYRLSRYEKPHPTLLLNIHKLIGLAALVYLCLTVYRVHQVTPLALVEIAASAISVLLFAATIVTGGLASIDKPLPAVLTSLHHGLPYLTVLTTAVTLFFLLNRVLS